MESDFWLEKWQVNQIGFHQEKINSRLKKYWNHVSRDDGAVFVPLCGKSADMIWLAERGSRVIGIELSEIACRDFFEENGLVFDEAKGDRFRRFSGDQIELLQGDFFALTQADLSTVSTVYDRASLVALPEDMRQRYAEHLAYLVSRSRQVLLISMDYDQSMMKGPPFSVTEDEVRTLFGDNFDVVLIGHSSGPDIVGNLSARGLDTLTEKVYLMTRK